MSDPPNNLKVLVRFYVNSWCLAKQSMAMWEIYGASGRGIALRSSLGRYRRAARFMVSEPHYRFGKIEYQSDLGECRDLMLDFADGVIPLPGIGLGERILNVGFHKRDCFQYEEEWRCALYQDEHPESRGLPIRFDLSELIAEVFVGPRAEEFFLKVVSSIMDKFDLQKPLNRSRLLEAPSRAASST